MCYNRNKRQTFMSQDERNQLKKDKLYDLVATNEELQGLRIRAAEVGDLFADFGKTLKSRDHVSGVAIEGTDFLELQTEIQDIKNRLRAGEQHSAEVADQLRELGLTERIIIAIVQG